MAQNYDLTQYDTDAVLSEGHILTTTVKAADGTTITSSLDLNTVVGNENGTLSWGGTNFTAGAQNVQIEEGDQLTADLPDSNGQMVHSILFIGSTATVDSNGKPAIKHAVGLAYSSAHATANNNDEADAAVLSQAATTGSSAVKAVTTVAGDASTYWPQGNAPASGHHASKVWHWVHFGVELIECFGEMI